MPEQEPVPSSALNAEAVAKALHTRAATVRDVAYGEGHQFSTGQGAVRLEIFPRTKVTRLTTQDARIELFGTTVSHVSDSGIEFRQPHPRKEANLTVLSDAGVVFTFIAGGETVPTTPSEPVQAPQTPLIEASSPSVLPDPEPAAPGDVTAPENDSPTADPRDETADAAEDASPPPPQPTGAEGRERGELVKFTGRLGKDPLVTGKAGRPPHIRLTLAEHYTDEDGQDKTRWHEVWAASSNIDAVKRMAEEGRLRRGVEVRVHGYRHERQPDAQGRPQRPFVRAFQIEPVKKKPTHGQHGTD